MEFLGRRYGKATEFYNNRAKTASGPGEATAYGSKKSRLMRYTQAYRLPFFDREEWKGSSLLDIGCGPGHFFEWLDLREDRPRSVHGIEITDLFVQMAHEKGHWFVEKKDAFDLKPDEMFDWITGNCLFAMAYTDDVFLNTMIVAETVRKMFQHCNKGICFDVMIGTHDAIVPDNEFTDYVEMQFTPETVRKMLEDLTARFVIDQSANKKFMTIYAFKRENLYERFASEDFE